MHPLFFRCKQTKMLGVIALVAVTSRVREIASPLGTLKLDTTSGEIFPTPPLRLPRSSNATALVMDEEGDDSDSVSNTIRRLQTASSQGCLKRIDLGVHIAPNVLDRLTRTQAEQYVRLVVAAASAIYEDHGMAVIRVKYVDFPPPEVISTSMCFGWTKSVNDHVRRHALTADVYSLWSTDYPCYSRSFSLGSACLPDSPDTYKNKGVMIRNVNGLGQGYGDVGVFAHELGHMSGLPHTFQAIDGCLGVADCYSFVAGVSMTHRDTSACRTRCEQNRRNGCDTIMSYDAFCERFYEEDGVMVWPGWQTVLRFHEENVAIVQEVLEANGCACACAASCVDESGRLHAFGDPTSAFGFADTRLAFRAYLGRSIVPDVAIGACGDLDDDGRIDLADLEAIVRHADGAGELPAHVARCSA